MSLADDLATSAAAAHTARRAAGANLGVCDLCGSDTRPCQLRPIRVHGWCWTCMPCRIASRMTPRGEHHDSALHANIESGAE